jgi:hypothetical protein
MRHTRGEWNAAALHRDRCPSAPTGGAFPMVGMEVGRVPVFVQQ